LLPFEVSPTDGFGCSRLIETRELLDGRHEISQFIVPGIGTMSLHTDVSAAKDTISKIRVLEKEHGFHVALAHDAAWMKQGVDEVLMSLLDKDLLTAARVRIPKDQTA
jgi:hypothetical protein